MQRRLAEPVAEECFELAEGPCWSSAGELTWVDAFRAAVLVAGVDEREIVLRRRYELAGPVTAALPLAGRDGWLLAAGSGFTHLRRDGSSELLAQPERAEHGVVRMNDAKCDPAGRLWAGSMGYDAAPGRGSLFRVDLDGSVERILDHTQQITNGIDWSPDGTTIYVNDSGHGVVYRAPYDVDSGAVGAFEPFIVVPTESGVPDGLTVDLDGMLWVALWGGASVHRYTPTGKLVERVAIPAKLVTSCCLGGTAMRTLFVTSARFELSADELAARPRSGCLFALEVDAPGVPARPFRGRLPYDGEETAG